MQRCPAFIRRWAYDAYLKGVKMSAFTEEEMANIVELEEARRRGEARRLEGGPFPRQMQDIRMKIQFESHADFQMIPVDPIGSPCSFRL